MKALADRLLTKTTPGPNGCVIWTGNTNNNGYPRLTIDGRAKNAQRIAHELFVGPIPDGHTVGRTCHQVDLSCVGGVTCLHRRCINFRHLFVMTRAEAGKSGRSVGGALAARTHCVHGHPFDEANTLVRKTGDRQCRACRRIGARNAKLRSAERAEQRKRAFGALYAAQQGFVTGVVLSEVRDRNFALAEDLTAEAFIRAWKAWPKCRATTDAQLRAWLRTIARHTVIDHYRVKRNTVETASDPTAWQYANQPVESAGGCYSVRSARQLTSA
ncbi:RNA polymerase sigma factor [Streptomyces sp. NPDC059076]|uniref:RNA polymerase sigma factor n=1 Tax=unclassified Streptomyces TaxID=2593676 RepID=UPI0036C01CBA